MKLSSLKFNQETSKMPENARERERFWFSSSPKSQLITGFTKHLIYVLGKEGDREIERERERFVKRRNGRKLERHGEIP